MFKKICLVTTLVIIVILLSGCTTVFKGETPSLEQKVDEEIEYMESEIIAMLNSLNNITYTNYKVVPTEVKQSNIVNNLDTQLGQTYEQDSQKEDSLETSGESTTGTEQKGGQLSNEQSDYSKQSGSNNSSDIKTYKMETSTLLDVTGYTQIDWSKIKSNIEILYTSWITMKIDLKEIGVSEDLLNNFSNEVNNTTISIKNEDKQQTMQGLTKMYYLLYEFVNSYSDNEYKISSIKTKMHTLSAYYYIEESKWEEAIKEMEGAEQVFEHMKNSSEIEEYKKVDIERSIILIVEMKNALQYADKELALLKYKNLIQELSVL